MEAVEKAQQEAKEEQERLEKEKAEGMGENRNCNGRIG
jgi:hypothetical protein